MKKFILATFFLFVFTLSACNTVDNTPLSNENIRVEAGYAHVVALDLEGSVFTWGRTLNGVLGNGVSDEETNELAPINITEKFDLNEGEIIVNIYVGTYTNFAITSANRVFVWGLNDLGQAGVHGVNIVSEPTEITERLDLNNNETIVKISSTNHTVILTSNNRVITFGNNAQGQLGVNDNETRHVSTPSDITRNFPLLPNETVDYIYASNDNFTIALTSNNRVLYFGRVAQYTNLVSPTEVATQLNLNSGETIEGIQEGNYPGFTTSEGRVLYLFRSNANSEFVELRGIDITRNLELADTDTVSNLVLGYRTNGVVLTSEGLIFPFGDNTDSRLGFESASSMIVPPYTLSSQRYQSIDEVFELATDETVLSISIGNHFMVLVTSENRVFTWGVNTFGVIGNGTDEDQFIPTELTLS